MLCYIHFQVYKLLVMIVRNTEDNEAAGCELNLKPLFLC
jgi:hypothetical protein